LVPEEMKHRTKEFTLRLIRLVLLMPLLCVSSTQGTEMEVKNRVDIMPVWSGHPVGFCLLTHGKHQFVGFYDAERRMTVAARTLDSDKWQFVRLPERVGWDSHNSITMHIDDNGHIHLMGNMHAAPLVYFRMDKPYDITTFRRIDKMIGRNEKRLTYPRFFRGPANEMILTYRDGGSGRGNEFYNVYDHKTKTWRRLLDTPLTDGQGKMNAYPNGPTRGPDGYFHLCWVWRDTPGCETNHDPSYARSKDLVHWETADGKKVKLPMTINTPGLIIDPTPVKGGIINGNVQIGFDSKNRVIISYHKFDPAGKTPVYNARLENGKWKIYQTSNWDYRWYFHGGGTIIFEIRIGGVRVAPDGKLVQSYRHVKHGSGEWGLDEATLKPIGKVPSKASSRPKELNKVESTFQGMKVNWQQNIGPGGEPGVQYWLRWETLRQNRDQPRKPPHPKPSMLRVYKLEILHTDQKKNDIK
jgi:hypothetical protein